MATMAELFTLARQHHQGGNLPEAERLYRRILLGAPHHADTHYFLGLLAHQTGHAEAAAALMRQAIALNPSVALYHSNLGVVLQAAGQPAEAWTSFTRALQLNPNLDDVHNYMGVVLLGQKRPGEAAACFRQARDLNPRSLDAVGNLGIALKDQGQLDEAIACYRQALRLHPQQAQMHHNLGILLQEQGRLEEALACYRQAVELNPRFADAYCNLGFVLQKQGQPAAAVESYRQALRINPGDSMVHNNLGNALNEQGQLAEAVDCYRQALQCNPRHADAHANLGKGLLYQGHLEEAAAHYEQALRVEPEHAAARWNRSFLWLLQGEMTRAWPDYEYRWKDPDFTHRTFAQPRWDGSPLHGKTILVHAEQGLGDTLQFIRYAPWIKQRGGNVLVECQPALLRLLEGVPGIDRLVSRGQPLPAFDVQVPLLSLPGLFQTTRSTIPADIPYLRADPRLVASWRQELEPLGGFKVGLVWQGNPRFRGDRLRSIPLAHFQALARVEGVRLVSLQKGPAADQLRALAGDFPILDLEQRLETFSDTAAVLMNLDLLISSCTAVPHLAGALGLPVWLALPFIPDWRWLLEGEDSPWYPHHRLFRQSRPGDWDEVFERIAPALTRWIGTKRGR